MTGHPKSDIAINAGAKNIGLEIRINTLKICLKSLQESGGCLLQ